MTTRMGQANIEQLAPALSRTATGVGTGIDAREYTGPCHCILMSGIGTGTGRTLDVFIEHSDTLGSGYTAVPGAAFNRLNGTAGLTQMITIKPDELKTYIRASWTLAGTTPTFIFGVAFVGVKDSSRNASQAI